MSLRHRLEKLRRQESERSRAAYQAFVGQLPNAEGRLVASDELLERGPLVICFYRGDWCPYCRAMLAALQAALPRIAAAGGRLVALTPDTGGRPLANKRRQRLTYDILCDV